MPQLDLVTFLPQYVWLIITFVGFYGFVALIILPTITRLVLLRVILIRNGFKVEKSNSSQLIKKTKAFYHGVCVAGKKHYKKLTANASHWCIAAVKENEKNVYLSFYTTILDIAAREGLATGLALFIIAIADIENNLANKSLVVKNFAEKLETTLLQKN